MAKNPNNEIEKCNKNIDALEEQKRQIELLLSYYEKKMQNYINEMEVVEDSLF